MKTSLFDIQINGFAGVDFQQPDLSAQEVRHALRSQGAARIIVASAPSQDELVAGLAKAEAVRATLEGPVSTACPASILRQHPNAVLYLDRDSASKLKP